MPREVLEAAHAGDCIGAALEALRANSDKPRKNAPPPTFDLVPKGAALLVRVRDAQLDDLDVFAPPRRLEYVAAAAAAAGVGAQAYSFNYDAAPPPKKKSLRRLLPKKTAEDDLAVALNREFAEATGIRHYRL